MPRYVYRCESCEEIFEQAHSIKIKLEDCHFCGTPDSLKRLPSVTRIINIDPGKKQRPGTVVRKHIEEAKRDIKREKEESSAEYKS
jgi:putative FmdB family regulatory protein